MNTSLGWHQLVGLTGPSAGAYFHTHLGLCGAGAAGRSPAQHCTLTTSSQTWDLPCRLPRECTWESHHHSALNLSSFPGDNPNKPMNPFITGVFGALAGAASVFGNTPLDVVKTRMQVQCQGLVWDTQCLGAGWGHLLPGTCFMQLVGQAHDACKVWFGRCLGLLLSHGECLHGGGTCLWGLISCTSGGRSVPHGTPPALCLASENLQMQPWLWPLILLSRPTGAGSTQVQEHLGLRLPDHETRRAPGVSSAVGVAGGRMGREGAVRGPSPTAPSLSLAGFTRVQCLAWAVCVLTWPSSSSSTMRWSNSSTRCGKRTEGPGQAAPPPVPRRASAGEQRPNPHPPAALLGPGLPYTPQTWHLYL